jgi:hypothetical protein
VAAEWNDKCLRHHCVDPCMEGVDIALRNAVTLNLHISATLQL